jgi:hypothetical protein
MYIYSRTKSLWLAGAEALRRKPKRSIATDVEGRGGGLRRRRRRIQQYEQCD